MRAAVAVHLPSARRDQGRPLAVAEPQAHRPLRHQHAAGVRVHRRRRHALPVHAQGDGPDRPAALRPAAARWASSSRPSGATWSCSPRPGVNGCCRPDRGLAASAPSPTPHSTPSSPASGWLCSESPRSPSVHRARAHARRSCPTPTCSRCSHSSTCPATSKRSRYEGPTSRSTSLGLAVLVTDYSSIAFNAAYIERPVVYFQFDADRVLGGAHVGQPGTSTTSATASVRSPARSPTPRRRSSRRSAPVDHPVRTYQERIDSDLPRPGRPLLRAGDRRDHRLGEALGPDARASPARRATGYLAATARVRSSIHCARSLPVVAGPGGEMSGRSADGVRRVARRLREAVARAAAARSPVRRPGGPRTGPECHRPGVQRRGVLAECLDSLLDQTLQSMEFIVVDDGSTDRSMDIVAEYAARDARFVVLTPTQPWPRSRAE